MYLPNDTRRRTQHSRSVGAEKLEAIQMAAEGPGAMMVLAMHVIGDGAANGQEPGSRHGRQDPSGRNREVENSRKLNARLASHRAAVDVEGQETVQVSAFDQRTARVETAVAIASAVAERQHGAVGFAIGQWLEPVLESEDPLRSEIQPTPAAAHSRVQSASANKMGTSAMANT